MADILNLQFQISEISNYDKIGCSIGKNSVKNIIFGCKFVKTQRKLLFFTFLSCCFVQSEPENIQKNQVWSRTDCDFIKICKLKVTKIFCNLGINGLRFNRLCSHKQNTNKKVCYDCYCRIFINNRCFNFVNVKSNYENIIRKNLNTMSLVVFHYMTTWNEFFLFSTLLFETVKTKLYDVEVLMNFFSTRICLEKKFNEGWSI